VGNLGSALGGGLRPWPGRENFQSSRDLGIAFVGGVLVDQRRPRRRVPEPSHELLGGCARNRAIWNKVRQFDTSGGAQLWMYVAQGLDNQVPTPGNTGARVLGYPASEASAMASTTTTGSKIIVMGDFRYYVIVDRVGMDIEVIPHLFGPTNRFPTGRGGALRAVAQHVGGLGRQRVPGPDGRLGDRWVQDGSLPARRTWAAPCSHTSNAAACAAPGARLPGVVPSQLPPGARQPFNE
jgi:Phage capsid family